MRLDGLVEVLGRVVAQLCTSNSQHVIEKLDFASVPCPLLFDPWGLDLCGVIHPR